MVTVLALAAFAAAPEVRAQEAPGPHDILVTGIAEPRGCIRRDARADDALDLDCLNRSIAGAAPGPAIASLSQGAEAARMLNTPSRTGTFSYAATSQRMGSNFGRAATPWRPASPRHAAPLLPQEGGR